MRRNEDDLNESKAPLNPQERCVEIFELSPKQGCEPDTGVLFHDDQQQDTAVENPALKKGRSLSSRRRDGEQSTLYGSTGLRKKLTLPRRRDKEQDEEEV